MRIAEWGRRVVVVCLLSLAACLWVVPAAAQEDMLRFIETKRQELKDKEEALKREEARVSGMRKEVEARIAEYTKLLAKLEEALKQAEKIREGKLENLVKAYESMPAEDAAARINALDHETALLIMLRMKSKKAGAVMAVMPPQKAARLTKSMATLQAKK